MPKGKNAEKNSGTVQALVAGNLNSVFLLDVTTTTGAQDDENSSVFYTVTSLEPTEENGKAIALCRFVAGKRSEDGTRKGLSIAATYGLSFSVVGVDKKDIEDIARAYVSTTAWAKYCSLFDMISRQMYAELPPLPAAPNKIDVLGTIEEFVNAG